MGRAATRRFGDYVVVVTPRTLYIDRRIRTLLDILFAVAIVSIANGSFVRDAESSFGADGVMAFYGIRSALIVVACAFWILLRTVPRVLTAVLFCFLGVAAYATDEVELAMVAIVVTFLYFGTKGGWIFSGLLAWMTLVAGVFYGSPVRDTLYLTIDLLMTFAMPTVLGLVLRRYQESAERLRALNRKLAASNLDLRKNAQMRQDLLLAEERARSASELHDGLGHLLTLSGMSLDYAERVKDADPTGAWEEVGTARDTVSEALSEVRTWARALHPVGTEAGVGLAGLDAIADSFRGTGLAVQVALDDELPELSEAGNLFVTRFVQEGLTNSLRHGRAANVWVRAQVADGDLRLELADDGRGCVEPPREGFGLRSLRERVESLQGELTTTCTADGFTIRAEFPLYPAALEFVS